MVEGGSKTAAIVTAVAALVTALVGAAGLLIARSDQTPPHESTVSNSSDPTRSDPTRSDPTRSEPTRALEDWAREVEDACLRIGPRLRTTLAYMDQQGADAAFAAELVLLMREFSNDVSTIELPTDPRDEERATEARDQLLAAYQGANNYASGLPRLMLAADEAGAQELWLGFVRPYNDAIANFSGLGAAQCTY